MVLNHIFSRRNDKGGIEYFSPDEVEATHDSEGRIVGAKVRSDGKPVDYDGIGTMSKSKKNGVDPQDMIDRYGADTSRFYVMQANPPTLTMLWSDESVDGSFRFLRWLWAQVYEHLQQKPAGDAGGLTPDLKQLRLKLHKTIEKVEDDYGRRIQFNTAIAAIRETLNAFSDLKDRSAAAHRVRQEVLEVCVLLLAPIVPHICTELWSALRPGTRLLDQPWPAVDKSALVQDEIELVVQVNGKLRGHIRVPAAATRADIEAAALADETVLRFLNGQTPKKVVVVPGRLVNVVV
jgi:leucyl-tRNA synthetase